jgi:dolichol kinase
MLRLFFIELRRKAFHLTGSLIPIVYYFLSKDTAVIALSLINAILLLIEGLRLSGKIRMPGTILRQHENKQVAAYIYFQMASLISIIIFDKTIAIASILMLAVGDAAAGLAGTLLKGGNVRNNVANKTVFKSLPIMAVMFTVCVIIGLILMNLPLKDDMSDLSFHVYVAGAIGATLGDAVPIRILGRTVDDNLIIPLLSGVFMTFVIFI